MPYNIHKYLLPAAKRATECSLQDWQAFSMFSKKETNYFSLNVMAQCAVELHLFVREIENSAFFVAQMIGCIHRMQQMYMLSIFLFLHTHTKTPQQIGQSQPRNQSTGVKKNL